MYHYELLTRPSKDFLTELNRWAALGWRAVHFQAVPVDGGIVNIILEFDDRILPTCPDGPDRGKPAWKVPKP